LQKAARTLQIKLNARSHAGAIGLMQLMPQTARHLKVNPHDLELNVDGGAKFLDMLITKYESRRNSLALVIAACNAGTGAVDRFGGIPPTRKPAATSSRSSAVSANRQKNNQKNLLQGLCFLRTSPMVLLSRSEMHWRQQGVKHEYGQEERSRRPSLARYKRPGPHRICSYGRLCRCCRWCNYARRFDKH
jgi:Transglycosylase SLT domain